MPTLSFTINQLLSWPIKPVSRIFTVGVFTLFLLPATLSANSSLASLQLSLTDKHGNPLEHVVVSLHNDNVPVHTIASQPNSKATMKQVKLQFSPAVIAIQVGTLVEFPNQDDFGHHVYSFSHPNAFELQLHHGNASQPQLFEHPGIVVLGCNIHDNMLGYIRVVDSPFFATSDANGNVNFTNLPAGNYEAQFWHPDLGNEHKSQVIQVSAGSMKTSFQIKEATGEPVQAAAEPAYGSTYSYEY